MKIINKTR